MVCVILIIFRGLALYCEEDEFIQHHKGECGKEPCYPLELLIVTERLVADSDWYSES